MTEKEQMLQGEELVDIGEDRRMMTESIWEKRRFVIGVKWLWIEKYGREL